MELLLFSCALNPLSSQSVAVARPQYKTIRGYPYSQNLTNCQHELQVVIDRERLGFDHAISFKAARRHLPRNRGIRPEKDGSAARACDAQSEIVVDPRKAGGVSGSPNRNMRHPEEKMGLRSKNIPVFNLNQR